MKSNAIAITLSDIKAELCADSVRVPSIAELCEMDAIYASIDARHDEWLQEMLGVYDL